MMERRSIKIIGTEAVVSLTQGKESVIEVTDVSFVQGRCWYACFDPTCGSFYARANERNENGSRCAILLHRHIMGVTDPTIFVDHKNRDTLDNRRINLRVCSPEESARNQGLRRDNKSGYKGVYFDKQTQSYVAYIFVKRVCHRKFGFKTAEAAYVYRQEVLSKLHGDFYCAG